MAKGARVLQETFVTVPLVTLDEIQKHCFKKAGKITEDFPFDEDVLVLRVNKKIFLLTNINQHPLRLNLKADPERAIEWRERYEAVQPGYHMNKKHWNTVQLDGTIPPKDILEMIDHSYGQVVLGLKKSERDKILRK